MKLPAQTQFYCPLKDPVKSHVHEDGPTGARTLERPQKRPFAACKVMLKELCSIQVSHLPLLLPSKWLEKKHDNANNPLTV